MNERKHNENPWVSGVIKGRIAETIVEQLFISLGFQVFKYGMENFYSWNYRFIKRYSW